MAPDKPKSSPTGPLATRPPPRLFRFGRQTAIGMLSGVGAGVLVGGIGGRIAMRISAILGGDSIQGLVTGNGNVVGQITAEGTLGLVVFAGVFTGLLGGLLYVAVRRWLPRPHLWRGLAFGVLLLVVFGSTVIDSGNADFARLGPRALNIALFALLLPLFGLAVVPIAEKLDRLLPNPARPGFVWNVAYLPVAAFGLFLLVTGVSFLVGDSPIAAPLPLVFALAVLPSPDPASTPAGGQRRLTPLFGYGLLGVLCLLGLALDLKSVVEILAQAA